MSRAAVEGCCFDIWNYPKQYDDQRMDSSQTMSDFLTATSFWQQSKFKYSYYIWIINRGKLTPSFFRTKYWRFERIPSISFQKISVVSYRLFALSKTQHDMYTFLQSGIYKLYLSIDSIICSDTSIKGSPQIIFGVLYDERNELKRRFVQISSHCLI